MNWFEEPKGFVAATLKHRVLFAAVCIVPSIPLMVWAFWP